MGGNFLKSDFRGSDARNVTRHDIPILIFQGTGKRTVKPKVGDISAFATRRP